MNREMVELIVNVATNGALDRVDQRGQRARELRDWGLNPHHAEPGSPLADDDAAFEAAYPLALSGGVGVSEESLFPMMSAAEALNAVGLLIEHRGDRGDLNAMPVVQLCRSAMESSARTIWILGELDREVRRDRALSVLVEQLEQQKRYLKIDADNEEAGLTEWRLGTAEINRSHRQNVNDLVQQLLDTYTIAKPDSFTSTVGLAAQWVDSHPPAHDTGDLAVKKIEGIAKTSYSWGSSFVHGYKWSVDYFPGVKLFPMIADSIAVAVFMTECAVALYEASCRGLAAPESNEQSHVPVRLEPTISAWSTQLFAN